MNPDHKKSLMCHRLGQADESLSEARVLLDANASLRSVCNRLYYAMFYSVLALLESKGVGTSKHSGAIAMFNREFVHTGILDKRFSKTLQNAFALRQEQDYRVVADPPRDIVNELMAETEAFIEAARSVLGLP